jgi:hypothetical protein
MTDIPPDILLEMYGLNAEQVVLWNRLAALVDEALEQYEKGYAVDVEQRMADIVKELLPSQAEVGHTE